MTSKQVKDFLKNEPSEFLSANCFQPHTLPQHVFAYASKNQHNVINNWVYFATDFGNTLKIIILSCNFNFQTSL